jgi:hypothetical protein
MPRESLSSQKSVTWKKSHDVEADAPTYNGGFDTSLDIVANLWMTIARLVASPAQGHKLH